MPADTTVRVDQQTRATLKEISLKRKVTISKVIAEALEAMEELKFLKAWEEGEQYLANNPEELEQAREETQDLDRQLGSDGLNNTNDY